MKAALILLTVILSVIIVSAEQEQNSVAGREDANVPSAFLNRDVRAAGAGKGKGKGNGSARRRRRRRKMRKNPPKSSSARMRLRNGNKDKNSKKSKKAKTPKPPRAGFRRKPETWRQAADTCFADLVAKTKKFNAAQTNGRMVTRMTNWKKVMMNKKNSSSSTFKDSLEAMTESTGNGTSCGGGGMDTDSKAVFDKLKNCAKTAASKCDIGAMSSPLNETLMMTCNATLTTFAKSFKECLNKATTAVCACVQGLKDPGKECLDFKAMNIAVKARRRSALGEARLGPLVIAGNKRDWLPSLGISARLAVTN